MFRLTKDEQKIIAFVVLVLLVGLAVRYGRASHHEPVANDAQHKEQTLQP
jgi:hypothetical protein